MEFFDHFFYSTLAEFACQNGCLDLVKYLVSLKNFDLHTKTTNVLIFVFFFIVMSFFFVLMEFQY